MPKTLLQRFEEKFERRGSNECWPWMKANNGVGYGQMWDPSRRRLVLAHRLAWELYRGLIPEGYEVDHQCHTTECKRVADCPHRACVNPRHLKPMTHQKNGARGNGTGGGNTRKTHCKRGHKFTTENTVIRQGRRQCWTCLREKERRRTESPVRQARRAAGLNVKTGEPLKKARDGSRTEFERKRHLKHDPARNEIRINDRAIDPASHIA